ncbi:uncharacterized protein [Sagmatias obliquidens]|uniref:uncharacterized protein n=1 Tax=Sagmatias obliquidens TaxID=3371155 RepID=UPI000F445040|nr:uncharacterized protein LOC113628220 [Lagenorhynchus obliquidens]
MRPSGSGSRPRLVPGAPGRAGRAAPSGGGRWGARGAIADLIRAAALLRVRPAARGGEASRRSARAAAPAPAGSDREAPGWAAGGRWPRRPLRARGRELPRKPARRPGVGRARPWAVGVLEEISRSRARNLPKSLNRGGSSPSLLPLAQHERGGRSLNSPLELRSGSHVLRTTEQKAAAWFSGTVDRHVSPGEPTAGFPHVRERTLLFCSTDGKEKTENSHLPITVPD